jgi:hypothetical protein
VEGGVGHAERREDALLQEASERHSGDPRDQHAEDLRPRVVEPAFARLIGQRQRTVTAQQLVRRKRRKHRTGREAGIRNRDLDRMARRKRRDHAEPEPEGEQVAQRDGALRRHRVVDPGFDRAQHLAVGEFGQPTVDGIVEPEPAFLDQDHRGDGRHRLGHRCDPEDGITLHRRAVERHAAEDIDMDLAAAADQRHDARHVARTNMVRQHFVHTSEPRPRQIAVLA